MLTCLAVDYNSWQESEKGLKLAASLKKDVILAEGYKEYNTGREYLAKMGDWRNDKDEEVELDGIGGVNILVKADVHRSGQSTPTRRKYWWLLLIKIFRDQFPLLLVRKPSRNRRIRQDGQKSWIPGRRTAELCCMAYRHRREKGQLGKSACILEFSNDGGCGTDSPKSKKQHRRRSS